MASPSRTVHSLVDVIVNVFIMAFTIRVLGVDSKNSKSNLRSWLMDLSSLTPDKQVKVQCRLDVIRQCRASGLPYQVWCEQHDISLKS